MIKREGTVMDVLQETVKVRLTAPFNEMSEVSVERALINKEATNLSAIKKMDKIIVQFSQDGTITSAQITVNMKNNNTCTARNHKIIKVNRVKRFVTQDSLLKTQNSLIKDTNFPEKPYIRHSSSLPPENRAPSNLLETVTNLNLTNENCCILSSTFASYIKINTGPNNLGLAIFEGIINHCFIYSDSTMLYQMHELLSKYHYLLLNNRDNPVLLLMRIIEIYNSEIKLIVKFEQLFELFNTELTDLVLIFRNCLQILVKTMYFSSKYEEFRGFRTQNEVLTRAYSYTATPELDHFNFVIDYFDVNLRLVNGDNLRVTDTGNIGKYIIYLFQSNSGYYPLYTIFENQLIHSDIQEYEQALRFWKAIKQDTTEPDEKVNALREDLEETKNQSRRTADMLVAFSKLYEPQPDFDSFMYSLEEENRKNAKDLLEGLYCHNCRNIQESIMFPCQHSFCQQCISLHSKESQMICSQCNFPCQISY